MKIIIAAIGKRKSLLGDLRDEIEFVQKCGHEIIEVIFIEGINDQLIELISSFELPTSIYSVQEIRNNHDFTINDYLNSLGADHIHVFVDTPQSEIGESKKEHLADFLH